MAWLKNMIDLHSHILPGIDDGARTMDESVKMVQALCAQGFNEIVATPHYVDGTDYISSKKKNEVLIRQLRKELRSLGVDVKLRLGNEVYIDERILEFIKDGKISVLGRSKFLLVELPLSGEFPNYRDILLELVQKGYKVVLAHPERYITFQENLSLVDELIKIGVLMQCNLGSIKGKYGRKAKKTLKEMAKADLIYAFGTDIHRVPEENYFHEAISKLGKYYDAKKIKKLLVENPKRLLK